MAHPGAWSTQQLAEFLAAVSSFDGEASAALGAVERAAEALDAEVVAIVRGGHVVASVGYPAGGAPAADLEAVARGVSHQLAVPGAGVCPATAVPLEYPPGATLILARSGSERLGPEEISLLHGMARATSLTMGMLRLLDDERSLRAKADRQAIEVGRLLARLTERQSKLEWLANEQAALRRVATLVASGVPDEQVFAAVAEGVSRVASADIVQMLRYEPDGSAVRVAAWDPQSQRLQIGARVPASELALQIAAPVVVEGRLWGVVAAVSTRPEPLAADAEQRVADFTELAATAISNAHARAELAASRRRVVTAADDVRRRIERDLYDGTQQRLVTLALKLRVAHDTVPDDLPELRDQLAPIEEELASLLDEIGEISRGLHPAILSKGGLGPAIRALAGRAAVPVALDVAVPERLPESVEVAAYYAVSEALANASEHANASAVEVHLEVVLGNLLVHVRDDGAGGADPGRGAGIVGLRDRVEALAGTMVLTSPLGEGTSMLIELPLGRG
ncbi:MAG: hypothetical protein JWN29_2474 [Acidimicrobiales bacterium]|nr:hypothetical protein [Acidimicrobiales bacterium]